MLRQAAVSFMQICCSLRALVVIVPGWQRIPLLQVASKVSGKQDVRLAGACESHPSRGILCGLRRRSRLRLTGTSGRSFRRAALLLVLSATLIVVVDWIAAFASGWVTTHDGLWGGDRLGESPWAYIVTNNDGIQLDSRDLLIQINGDQLTARYTVTAPSSSAFTKAATTDDSQNSGNDLVDAVLGKVQIAEFRYGFTGKSYTYYSLPFEEPQLTLKGTTATVTVESEPFRLYLSRQHLTVDRPREITVSDADNVVIEAPGIQVAHPSGATIQGITGSSTTLTANSLNVGTEIWEDGASQGWLAGLRALGNTTIPVAGYSLNLFQGTFVYLVLLWSLSRITVNDPAKGTARRVTLATVGGLSATAFLWTMLHICEVLTNYRESSDSIVAGPMGLLATGSVAWLAISLRIWRSDETESPDSDNKRGLGRAVTVLCISAVLGLYAAALGLCPMILRWLDIPTSQDATIMILAALTATLVIVIARLLVGGGVLPWLLSLPMTALTLAAVVGWPVIWYSNFDPGGLGYVNIWGKWIYLAIVAAVTVGLAVMFTRVFWLVTRPYGKAWQWISSATVAAGIAVAILPNAVSESGVMSPTTTGLVPYNLFNFFLDLPSLLSWLLIIMAFLVAIELRSAAGARSSVRLLAIPIVLELFYGTSGWLYLPLERVLGLPLVVWLLLPRRLITDDAAADESSNYANNAIDQWRAAEFMAGQRQALASSGTDALRDLLLKSDRRFDKGLAALAAGQAKLSRQRDKYRRDARKANTDAFSRYGRPFSGRDARAGFIVGAILGIIPASVTVLTTQPPVDNGVYPVLFFLGGTAWRISVWALLGCFIGYFQPLVHGENGVEKGTLMFLVKMAPVLAIAAIWDDANGWAGLLVATLEILVFLVVATIILDDLRVLQGAGLRVTDWTRVHNWRLVVTWSTAVIAAIGTAAATFLSTAATDLSQQTVGAVTSQIGTSATNPNVSSPGSSG